MDARAVRLGEIDKIVLTGFMGSGKSTVGHLLAERLGWNFADLDEFISERHGLSVPEIFAQHGESVFRQLEVASLTELLHRAQLVISLGGGAPETQGIRHLLSQATRIAVIHLDAPFETLYNRCVSQAADPGSVARPLLGERDAALDRYLRRIAVYAEVAHHRADVARRSPLEVVEDILSTLCTEVTPR